MKTHLVKPEDPKVIGLAIITPRQKDDEVERSLVELGELLKTLGAQMISTVIQRRDRTPRTTYFGKGKLAEVKELAEEQGAEFLVADDELNSIQIKNIELQTGLKVKDRTSVILDIFAKHATTREGKLQVELAMLQYQLPRLLRMWTHLERQRGGIGLKGPGETQLETDRRILGIKIKKLNEELEKVSRSRDLQSKKRTERFSPLFSLVGYTNAGKSTLLNRLSGSSVEMHDGLFTTLDPTARRLDLPDGHWCILSDTVGFVRKLPHTLIEAFKATLESVLQSEVLLLVCDVSDPDFRDHLAAVESVLSQIGAAGHEKIVVFNKIDKSVSVSEELLRSVYPDCVFISAITGQNISDLEKYMQKIMRRNRKTVEIELPAGSPFIGEAMKTGKVLSQEWGSGFVRIKAELPHRFLTMLKNSKQLRFFAEVDTETAGS